MRMLHLFLVSPIRLQQLNGLNSCRKYEGCLRSPCWKPRTRLFTCDKTGFRNKGRKRQHRKVEGSLLRRCPSRSWRYAQMQMTKTPLVHKTPTKHKKGSGKNSKNNVIKTISLINPFPACQSRKSIGSDYQTTKGISTEDAFKTKS